MLLQAVAEAAARDNTAARNLLEEQGTACVREVLGHRKTRWTHGVLAGIAQTVPGGARIVLMRCLASMGSGARNEFVRIEALLSCATCLRCAQVMIVL